mmetsp:Transcript_13127/g.43230  ORF Transcript_13127/g.43230 Transcript_13127/m.43230 type:complete len:136 (+) Transcript_13127:26-433(+)
MLKTSELPRLARPTGESVCVRSNKNSLSLETELGRKAVTHDSRNGVGAAFPGDKAYKNVEYSDRFMKGTVNTPTFERFCSTLQAVPSPSPTQRRAQARVDAGARATAEEVKAVEALDAAEAAAEASEAAEVEGEE